MEIDNIIRCNTSTQKIDVSEMCSYDCLYKEEVLKAIQKILNYPLSSDDQWNELLIETCERDVRNKCNIDVILNTN